MIKVEKLDVWGFKHAIRGMRNPMNSWDRSDSDEDKVGPNDLTLMKNLYKASLSGNHAHRKFMRQIFVSMDITAPLYWWKEFDTYKVGTVANSCSTMHKIHEKDFSINDFSHEHCSSDVISIDSSKNITTSLDVLYETVIALNSLRRLYLETKDKEYWYQMIQLLPSSYNQKRTITMSYENAVTIILQRRGHKLEEWQEFVSFLQSLPYIVEITDEKWEGTDA